MKKLKIAFTIPIFIIVFGLIATLIMQDPLVLLMADLIAVCFWALALIWFML